MDKRLKYLYRRVLVNSATLRSNDYNHWYPKTEIDECNVGQNGHNGDWEDETLFDLGEPEEYYEYRFITNRWGTYREWRWVYVGPAKTRTHKQLW